jgi:AcrR family transcriptional regulator
MTTNDENLSINTLLPRRSRRSHDERKAETRARLLQSAWELFVEFGYEAVSLNAIAEHAGYTRTPIHQLYGGKGELYAAVLQQQLEQLRPRQLKQIREAQTVRELLRLVLERLVSCQEDSTYHAIHRLTQTVRLLAESDTEAMTQFVEVELKFVQRFADRLEVLGQNGPPLAGDPGNIARRIDSYVSGLQQLAHPKINPIDTEEAMRAMLTLAYCQPPQCD